MFSNLSFTTWNIHGLFNKVLGDKSKNQDFIEAITKNDFVFLTETWGNQNIHIPGFETINSKLVTALSKQKIHRCCEKHKKLLMEQNLQRSSEF
jgi:hypothetical protein